jgi:hypothetical protein
VSGGIYSQYAGEGEVEASALMATSAAEVRNILGRFFLAGQRLPAVDHDVLVLDSGGVSAKLQGGATFRT